MIREHSTVQFNAFQRNQINPGVYEHALSGHQLHANINDVANLASSQLKRHGKSLSFGLDTAPSSKLNNPRHIFKDVLLKPAKIPSRTKPFLIKWGNQLRIWGNNTSKL